MNNTIQVRIDTKTKKAVAKIFEELGLDISTGVKIYFSQVLRQHGVPFALTTENGYTPKQEAKLLKIAKETERDYRKGKLKSFASVKEMRKDLLS